jgi:hypothetical protein
MMHLSEAAIVRKNYSTKRTFNPGEWGDVKARDARVKGEPYKRPRGPDKGEMVPGELPPEGVRTRSKVTFTNNNNSKS